MSKWALTKKTQKILSLAVQVHIGTPEGPILVQCVPCTAIMSTYFGIFCKSSFTHVPEWGIFVFIKKIRGPSLPV